MKKKPPISDEDRQLFRDTVRNIRRVTFAEKIITSPKKTNRASVGKSTSDIMLTDNLDIPFASATEHLLYNTAGVRQNTLRQLKRGQFYIDDSLDLHGMNIAMAKQAIIRFLANATKKHYQCIHIIHGKSYHTFDIPKLKNAVNQWLRQYDSVLAFCSATPQDGGSGAVYVLLRKPKKT